MSDLDLKLSKIDGAVPSGLVEVTGVLDASTTPRFESTLGELLGKGVKQVVLNLAGIRYLNSTGLGVLVKHADAFRAAGGGMALAHVPGKVQIIMEMSGLDKLLAVRPSVQDALAALTNPTAETQASQDDSVMAQSGRWRSAASRLAAEDPELAMRRCRGALEKALPRLYRKTAGDPSGLDIPTLVQALEASLPTKVLALIHSVWVLAEPSLPSVYRSEDSIRREAYIAVASMTVLQSWFKQEHPDVWS